MVVIHTSVMNYQTVPTQRQGVTLCGID